MRQIVNLYVGNKNFIFLKPDIDHFIKQNAVLNSVFFINILTSMRTYLLLALLGICLLTWAQSPEEINPQFPGQNMMSIMASPQIIEDSKNSYLPTDNFAPQQVISIPQGWSGISGFVIPDNPNIEFLMKPLMDKFVILYNNDGLYYPEQNINTLVNWNPQSGYIAKFSQPASMGLSGQVNSNRTITLNAGWNLIPVLSNCPVNVVELFQNQNVVLVKDVATYKLYWPEMGINNLNELLPGKAYYVLMSAPGVITFPDCTVLAWQCGEPFVDPRDNSVYPTTLIGPQCWMAANLNYGTRINGTQAQTNNSIPEKYCYNNLESECFKYGGLYQWDEMMQYTQGSGTQGLCPDGWYIPNESEWNWLTNYLGGNTTAGGSLKSTASGFWSQPNTGATNSVGFNGLPGGQRELSGLFSNLTFFGNFWSSTQPNTALATRTQLAYNNSQLATTAIDKNTGFSMRCLKRQTLTVNPETMSIYHQGGVFPVELNSSTSWTIEENIPWLSISQLSGYGNTTLTITCDENIYEEERVGNINISATGTYLSVTIEVTQLPLLWSCGDPIEDSRDGTIYPTVKVGSQCWLGANLNIGNLLPDNTEQINNSTIEKYCSGNEAGQCAIYGGLYQWSEMMEYSNGFRVKGICPEGWRLPESAEWDEMVQYLGGEWIAGGKMKTTGTIEAGTGLWYEPNTGASNSSGFSMLPAGYRYGDESITGTGYAALLWSSDYNSGLPGSYVLSNTSEDIFTWNAEPNSGFSVRCIMQDTADSYLKVSPARNVVSAEAGSVMFAVSSNTSWQVTETTDWLTIDPATGTGNGQFTVNCNANLIMEQRSASVWLISEGRNIEIIISQTEFIPVLTITPASPSLPDFPGTINLIVQSNIPWLIEENPEWFSITPMTGNGNDTLILTHEANIGADVRVGQFTISGINGNPTIQVSVNQAGFHECGNPLLDTRDSKSYNTVQIGTQCWMAQNLNLGTLIIEPSEQTNNGIIEKYCYNNDETNCEIYGGLYKWDEMMQYTYLEGTQGICPPGWHLPTDGEWCILTTYLDSTVDCNKTGLSGTDCGGKMKQSGTSNWNAPNQGATNLSGFSGLPGGYRDYDGGFLYKGNDGIYWLSSQYNSTFAWYQGLTHLDALVHRFFGNKNYGFSVRCLKDVPQIEVTPSTQSVTYQAGTTTFSIASNTAWTVNENVEWLTVTPMNGAKNGILTVTYDENATNAQRTGQITITAYGGSPEITVSLTQVSEMFNCGDILIDARDSKSYNTVQIGTQCWMAQNLNVGIRIDGISDQSDNGTIEKYCYNNSDAQCDIYGGYYQWNEMMQYTTAPGSKGICPIGWHLPTDGEWTALTNYVSSQTTWICGGNTDNIAKALASISGWTTGSSNCAVGNNQLTNNVTGFSGLPSGARFPDGGIGYLWDVGNWWSSSQTGSSNAWPRGLHYNSATVGGEPWYKAYGFSVRCLKDIPQLEVTPTSQNVSSQSGTTTFTITSNTGWTVSESEDWLAVSTLSGNGDNTLIVNYDENMLTESRSADITITAWGGNPIVIVTVTQAGAPEPWSCGQDITDERDGQVYPTVLIGDQCWMAENLNVGTTVNGSINQTNDGKIEKFCYNDDEANCNIYGGLYQWDEMMQYTTSNAAQGICPIGWHIPTNSEWSTLTLYISDNPLWICGLNNKYIAKAVASTTYWNSFSDNCAVSNDPSSNNASGFAGLPGGLHNTDGLYYSQNSTGAWWSSTQFDLSYSWRRGLNYRSAKVHEGYANKNYGFSVRCLKD